MADDDEAKEAQKTFIDHMKMTNKELISLKFPKLSKSREPNDQSFLAWSYKTETVADAAKVLLFLKSSRNEYIAKHTAGLDGDAKDKAEKTALRRRYLQFQA